MQVRVANGKAKKKRSTKTAPKRRNAPAKKKATKKKSTKKKSTKKKSTKKKSTKKKTAAQKRSRQSFAGARGSARSAGPMGSSKSIPAGTFQKAPTSFAGARGSAVKKKATKKKATKKKATKKKATKKKVTKKKVAKKRAPAQRKATGKAPTDAQMLKVVRSLQKQLSTFEKRLKASGSGGASASSKRAVLSKLSSAVNSVAACELAQERWPDAKCPPYPRGYKGPKGAVRLGEYEPSKGKIPGLSKDNFRINDDNYWNT